MRYSSLTLFLVLISFVAPGQTDLVDIDLVGFHSEDEKTSFTNYIRKGKADNFMLLMASGTLLNPSKVNEAKDRFYKFLATYENEKFASKKSEKKTKQIYDDIHKTFLLKFENGSQFEEIFYNGNFSNLTATALYALAFEQAKIPFAILEEPDHIYLMAYPESERIKVEVTSPLLQILIPTDEFKAQYVKVLKENKLIPPSEGNQSVNILFNKYYYGNQQSISTANLIGLLYMEQAVQKMQQNNFEGAFNQAEKAYLLFPSPKTSYLLTVTGTNAFDSRKKIDSVKAIQLAKLSRYYHQGIPPEAIETEFIQVTQELLFERSKPSELDDFFNVLRPRIDHVQLQNDIEFVYNYEKGRYFYNSSRYAQALPLFEKAIKAKPDKLDAVNAFISTVGMRLSESGDNLQNLKILEGYSRDFPTLHNHNQFNNILLSSYLIQVAMDYDNNNSIQAEKYRNEFEALKLKYPDAQANGQLVGQAYSRAAIYFYRKGQTQKAKTLIDTGLKYSPNNYELITRKRMMN